MIGEDQASLGVPGSAERARNLAYLFLSGGVLGLVLVGLLPLPPDTNVTGVLVTVGLSLLVGSLLLAFAGRQPAWAVPAALVMGTMVVSGDVYFAGDVRTDDEMLYVLVCFYAFYFLSLRQALAQMVMLGGAYGLVLLMRGEPDGPARWVLTVSTLLVAGLLIRRLVSALVRGAEHSVKREGALRQAEEQFRGAFDDAAVGMALVDLEGRWIRVNDALVGLLGRSADELVGMSFRDVTVAQDAASDAAALRGLVSGEQTTHHAEKRYRHADGAVVWVSLSVSLVRDDSGRPLHLISQMQDITERKVAERELTTRALQDPLTGLPNRSLFMDRLGVALARIQRKASPLSVFFLDLDRFKLVNDSLGHAAGDRLVIEAAGRLRELLRPDDTVARIGGDEFTVLCEATDEHAASALAERIGSSLCEPFLIDDREVFVSASIGITVARDGAIAAESLTREADAAMYRAKERGRSRFTIFDGGMRLRGAERLELENELRRAIATEELVVHYQPEVWLESGRISGVEALVRWNHPRWGLIAPDEFIPVAEESGLIVALGTWVLRTACMQARAWRDAHDGHSLCLAVNLSPRQLAESDVIEVVSHALQASAIEPRSLCLEITESAVVDVGLSTLESLQKLGVRLAIDDFGVGFSSLNQIRRMPPVDTLKIDRSFVEDLGRGRTDTAIVAAIIGMARSLAPRPSPRASRPPSRPASSCA